jgi:hypothetical protein
MVIREIGFEDAPQVLIVEYDDMIEAVSANRADQSLGIRVLPRTTWCDGDFVNAHSADSTLEILAKDRIPVTDQIARGLIERKRLNQLLGCPLASVMRRDIEMDHKALLMREDDEAIQDTIACGGNCEKIYGPSRAHDYREMFASFVKAALNRAVACIWRQLIRQGHNRAVSVRTGCEVHPRADFHAPCVESAFSVAQQSPDGPFDLYGLSNANRV